MKLGARIGLTMGVLTILTAALVAGTGYGVTRNRLDSEITSSLEAVIDPVRRDPLEARLLCSFFDRRSSVESPFIDPTLIDSPPGVHPRDGSGGDDDGDDPGPRRKGRGGRRVFPREVLVQCLDSSGAVTNPLGTVIPVTDSDKQLAASETALARTTTVDINEVSHRVMTASVPDSGAVQVARSLAERNRVLNSLLRRSVVAALLSGLLAAAVGLWLAKRLVRPLEMLSAAAEQVARTGELSVSPAPTSRGRDETSRLTRSFHEMLASLHQSREAQARLVQDAGHELRTPLTSLRANVSLLKRPDLPSDKRQVALDDLDLELRELTLVTNELVSLAADTGEPEAAEVFDLSTLVAEAAQRWARRSGRLIATDLNTTPLPLVSMPQNAARRAIDNVFSNAIKFSPANTVIDAGVVASADSVTVTIRDRGPGIAPEDLARVFERFYRADTARSITGSGLGLSIVHDVVVSVGGTVTATRHHSGGTVITITTPRVADT